MVLSSIWSYKALSIEQHGSLAGEIVAQNLQSFQIATVKLILCGWSL